MNSDDASTSRDHVGLIVGTVVDALFGSFVRALLYSTLELFRRIAGATRRRRRRRPRGATRSSWWASAGAARRS